MREEGEQSGAEEQGWIPEAVHTEIEEAWSGKSEPLLHVDRESTRQAAHKGTTLREMILFTYQVWIYRDRGTPARMGSGIRAARPAPRSSDCSSRPQDHRSNSRPRQDREASPASTLYYPDRHVCRL